jgi:hypothetical protein
MATGPVSVFDERRAKDRTSDQPQVKLSLLSSNSLKMSVQARRKQGGPKIGCTALSFFMEDS